MDSKESKDSKSPSLELISEESKVRSYERRNLPRLSLTSEQFRLAQNQKIFSVSDISQKGMGLWLLDQADLEYFAVGSEIEGHLNLEREKYAVRAHVRNVAPDRVGCEFEVLSPETQKALDHLLDPKILGRELKPIPSAGKNMLWYHGPSGTDLLLRRLPDGQYERMTLYVLGTFVQWDEEQGLSTGRALASDLKSEVRGILRLETLYLDSDPKADRSKLGIAKTVILSSNLPQDLINWCIRKME